MNAPTPESAAPPRLISVLCSLIFVSFFSVVAVADDGVRFAYEPVSRLTLIEKENVRIREDGVYSGYLYRERRGSFMLGTVGDAGSRYSGLMYLLEDVREQTSVAKRIEDTRKIAFSLSPSGHYENTEERAYPRLRDFPVYPDQKLGPGDSWRAFGVRFVDGDGDGESTRLRFYCEYRYSGLQAYYGREVHVITAQYASRYRAGDDPQGDPDLSELSGKHVVTILVDAQNTTSTFIRDQLDEVYRYRDGPTISHVGFALRWTNWAPPIDRGRAIAEIDKAITDQELKDVRVEERSEGLALTVEAVHFVADEATFLPSEAGRLDSIAAILVQHPDRRFMVVGHTADVGSAESQYELSVERALAFVGAMGERGIPADRFIYQGKGGTEPVAPNDTEENMAKNRRVEVIILDR